jgi:hypothetical protein
MLKLDTPQPPTEAAAAAAEGAETEAAAEAITQHGQPLQLQPDRHHQQEQQVEGHEQQQQPQSPLLQLLLACAPNPHDFLQEVGGAKPRYWAALCGTHCFGPSQSFCMVWSELLLASPRGVLQEAVRTLLEVFSSISNSSNSSIDNPSSSGSPALGHHAEDADAGGLTTAETPAAEEPAAADAEDGSRADVSACNVWCWSCHGSGRYSAAAAAAASRDAGKLAAAEALKCLHLVASANSTVTGILAQQGNLQLLPQLLQSDDPSERDIAAQLLLMIWQLPKQQYERQQVRELTAAAQQLVRTALSDNANSGPAMRVISSIGISGEGLDWLMDCKEQIVTVLAEQAWQQQQQLQAEHDKLQQSSVHEQQQRQQRSVVFASFLLMKLAQRSVTALLQCLRKLPAAVNQCLRIPHTASDAVVGFVPRWPALNADTQAEAAADPGVSCYLQHLLQECRPDSRYNYGEEASAYVHALQDLLLYIAATAPIQLLAAALQNQCALLPKLTGRWPQSSRALLQHSCSICTTANAAASAAGTATLPAGNTADDSSRSSSSSASAGADLAPCVSALLASSTQLPDTIAASRRQLLLSILLEIQSLQLLGAALQQSTCAASLPVEVFGWLL